MTEWKEIVSVAFQNIFDKQFDYVDKKRDVDYKFISDYVDVVIKMLELGYKNDFIKKTLTVDTKIVEDIVKKMSNDVRLRIKDDINSNKQKIIKTMKDMCKVHYNFIKKLKKDENYFKLLSRHALPSDFKQKHYLKMVDSIKKYIKALSEMDDLSFTTYKDEDKKAAETLLNVYKELNFYNFNKSTVEFVLGKTYKPARRRFLVVKYILTKNNVTEELDKISYDEEFIEENMYSDNCKTANVSDTKKKEWLLKNCTDCQNPITLEDYDNENIDDIISMKFLKQDTSGKFSNKFGKGRCIPKTTLIEYLKQDLSDKSPSLFNKSYIFSLWEKNENEDKVRFPYVSSSKLIVKFLDSFFSIRSISKLLKSNKNTFYAVPLFGGKKQRIGNLASSYAESRLHGQEPGEVIYNIYTKEEIQLEYNTDIEVDFNIKYKENGKDKESIYELIDIYNMNNRDVINILDKIINTLIVSQLGGKNSKIKKYICSLDPHDLAEIHSKHPEFIKYCKPFKKQICKNLINKYGGGSKK